jgi:hypothetical protein
MPLDFARDWEAVGEQDLLARPPDLIDINWDHPVADAGLQGAVLFHGDENNGPFELVRGCYPSSKAGTWTAVVDPVLGQVANVGTARSTPAFNYLGGYGPATLGDTTFAAFITFGSDVTQHQFITSVCNTAGTAGVLMGITSGNLEFTVLGGIGGIIPVTANTPYFVVVSCSATGNICNFVAKRLDTGAVVTGTSAISPSVAGAGNWCVGNASTRSLSCQGSYAAVIYSTTYFPMDALVRWSEDPWAFFKGPLDDIVGMQSVLAGGGAVYNPIDFSCFEMPPTPHFDPIAY